MMDLCENHGINGVVAGRYCGRKKSHHGPCWFTREHPDAAPPVERCREIASFEWCCIRPMEEYNPDHCHWPSKRPKMRPDWLAKNLANLAAARAVHEAEKVKLQIEEALELLRAIHLTATHHSGAKKNLKRAIISVQNAIRCRES